MNVGELIKELSELDPNLPVLVSRDPEGNGFRDLWQVEPDSTFTADGRDFDVGVTQEYADEHDGYSDEDVQEDPCVVLWPG